MKSGEPENNSIPYGGGGLAKTMSCCELLLKNLAHHHEEMVSCRQNRKDVFSQYENNITGRHK